MSKRKVDPVDGTLIGVAEVSALTGFTAHQIRSWRKEENQDKAVFEALRDPNSSSVWYRLVDIEDWREEHGKQSFMRAIPAPNAFRSKRVGVEIEDYDKRLALETLSSIQPDNVLSVFERLLKQDNKTTFRYANTERMRLIKLEIPEWNPLERQINSDTRFSEPIWFPTMVKAMRLAQNEMAGLGFTEQEVLEMPIGNYPPLKETKG